MLWLSAGWRRSVLEAAAQQESPTLLLWAQPLPDRSEAVWWSVHAGILPQLRVGSSGERCRHTLFRPLHPPQVSSPISLSCCVYKMWSIQRSINVLCVALKGGWHRRALDIGADQRGRPAVLPLRARRVGRWCRAHQSEVRWVVAHQHDAVGNFAAAGNIQVSPVKQIQPLHDDTCVRRIHKDVPAALFLTFLWFLMCAGQSLMNSNGCFLNGFILTLNERYVLDVRDVTWVTLLVDIVCVWICLGHPRTK